MASFSESSFVKKLLDLNPSQQSIQTLSLWLIHHRKHSKAIMQVWMKELKKQERTSKKLTFLYLANDVIQNSKKKGPEFNRDFRLVLPEAYRHTAKGADDKIRGSMGRMISIWKERGVFEDAFTEKMQAVMAEALGNKAAGPVGPAGVEKPPKAAAVAPVTAERQPKTAAPGSSGSTPSGTPEPARSSEPRKRSGDAGHKESKRVDSKKGAVDTKKGSDKRKRKVELSLREEIELEIKKGVAADPPDVGALDLVKALQDLENSASCDAAVRERIAALPPEVSDVSRLEKIRDRAAADELASTVNEACSLLADYNTRLGAELQERRRVARMLRDFIGLQKDALNEAEQKLQEHKSKLEKVAGVRKELKSHMQSLPDLTLLPDVTGGLAPLPSAGDLFQ